MTSQRAEISEKQDSSRVKWRPHGHFPLGLWAKSLHRVSGLASWICPDRGLMLWDRKSRREFGKIEELEIKAETCMPELFSLIRKKHRAGSPRNGSWGSVLLYLSVDMTVCVSCGHSDGYWKL